EPYHPRPRGGNRRPGARIRLHRHVRPPVLAGRGRPYLRAGARAGRGSHRAGAASRAAPRTGAAHRAGDLRELVRRGEPRVAQQAAGPHRQHRAEQLGGGREGRGRGALPQQAAAGPRSLALGKHPRARPARAGRHAQGARHLPDRPRGRLQGPAAVPRAPRLVHPDPNPPALAGPPADHLGEPVGPPRVGVQHPGGRGSGARRLPRDPVRLRALPRGVPLAPHPGAPAGRRRARRRHRRLPGRGHAPPAPPGRHGDGRRVRAVDERVEGRGDRAAVGAALVARGRAPSHGVPVALLPHAPGRRAAPQPHAVRNGVPLGGDGRDPQPAAGGRRQAAGAHRPLAAGVHGHLERPRLQVRPPPGGRPDPRRARPGAGGLDLLASQLKVRRGRGRLRPRGAPPGAPLHAAARPGAHGGPFRPRGRRRHPGARRGGAEQGAGTV
ncbi:MAG: glycoside hydrolase, partial [uncultured Gemmatimonadetes bacterium]